MRAFLKRPYHYFVSYSRKDAAPFASQLEHWLRQTAGLNPWFDQSSMDSGEPLHRGLAKAVGQCQGVIFLLSDQALQSGWVQKELDQALTEKDRHSRFQIVLLRVDTCDVARHCPAIRTLTWNDLMTPTGPCLTLRAAAELLCRIHQYDGWHIRQHEQKELYVSRGWREGEEEFGDAVCRLLAVRGLRLVGDLPDQPSTDRARIAAIMRYCYGHAFVLPRRAGPDDYKRFFPEFELSKTLGLPRAVFAQASSPLPPELQDGACFVGPDAIGDPPAPEADRLRDRVYDFVESLLQPQSEVHAFFASDYKSEGTKTRNELARDVVEATGTLPCHWGKEYDGYGLQQTIVQAIRSAKFVVADLTSPRLKPGAQASEPAVNLNTCVEAGIAWGAGVRTLLLAAENPHPSTEHNEGKTKYVPFMFKDAAQLELYGEAVPGLAPGVEFLGLVHKAVLKDRMRFGRRVINPELGL